MYTFVSCPYEPIAWPPIGTMIVVLNCMYTKIIQELCSLGSSAISNYRYSPFQLSWRPQTFCSFLFCTQLATADLCKMIELFPSDAALSRATQSPAGRTVDDTLSCSPRLTSIGVWPSSKSCMSVWPKSMYVSRLKWSNSRSHAWKWSRWVSRCLSFSVPL